MRNYKSFKEKEDNNPMFTYYVLNKIFPLVKYRETFLIPDAIQVQGRVDLYSQVL